MKRSIAILTKIWSIFVFIMPLLRLVLLLIVNIYKPSVTYQKSMACDVDKFLFIFLFKAELPHFRINYCTQFLNIVFLNTTFNQMISLEVVRNDKSISKRHSLFVLKQLKVHLLVTNVIINKS